MSNSKRHCLAILTIEWAPTLSAERSLSSPWAISLFNRLPNIVYTPRRLEDYNKLIQMGSRWYDAELGRFIFSDTIIPQPFNTLAYDRYQYAYSNPVRYTDSSGHCIDGITTWACIAIFGGIVLKAIDYGWTAWDAYQSGRVLANPNVSREDKLFAGLKVGLDRNMR